MNKLKLLVVILCLTTVISCNKDDNKTNTSCGSASLKFDGSNFNVSSMSNTILKMAATNDLPAGKRVDLRLTNGTNTIFIGFSDTDNGTTGNGVHLGTYKLNNTCNSNTCNTAFFSVYQGNLNDNISFPIYTSDPSECTATVTITNVDETNKTMSGTFSGTVTDYNEIVNISNGTFTNICYSIVE